MSGIPPVSLVRASSKSTGHSGSEYTARSSRIEYLAVEDGEWEGLLPHDSDGGAD